MKNKLSVGDAAKSLAIICLVYLQSMAKLSQLSPHTPSLLHSHCCYFSLKLLLQLLPPSWQQFYFFDILYITYPMNVQTDEVNLSQKPPLVRQTSPRGQQLIFRRISKKADATSRDKPGSTMSNKRGAGTACGDNSLTDTKKVHLTVSCICRRMCSFK